MKSIVPSMRIVAKLSGGRRQLPVLKLIRSRCDNGRFGSDASTRSFSAISLSTSTSYSNTPEKLNGVRGAASSQYGSLNRRTSRLDRSQAFFSTTSTSCPRQEVQQKQEQPKLEQQQVVLKNINEVGSNTASLSVRKNDVATHQTIETKEMNLFTAINDALHIAMHTNDSTIIFGEDVAFGGVFRCTQNLQSAFGKDRVFNTPLSEVGIIGMAIGYAATSHNSIAIAEIQFADYIFPALDQICNEISKFRYRSGNQWDCAGVTIRTPYGCVGHGGHYHSQSPESYLCHTPGLTVVVPRSPYTAKGLLLSSIRSPNPVIFLEPKALYRTAIEAVPIHDYEIPLSQAEIIRTGSDITLIGWGQQLRMIEQACDLAQQTHNISCEIIDVQTLVPCDYETMIRSVQKTGKCIISHEAPITLGFGAELCATIQSECFYSLQVPITRICGYDIPFPLVHEKYYVPDTYKIYDAILNCIEQAK